MLCKFCGAEFFNFHAYWSHLHDRHPERIYREDESEALWEIPPYGVRPDEEAR